MLDIQIHQINDEEMKRFNVGHFQREKNGRRAAEGQN
jgi:hypothetical protein